MCRGFRPQIADRHGDCRVGMERIAELVGAERLDVVFEIGRRRGFAAAREDAELARRHRQRPAPHDGILHRHSQLAEATIGELVQGLGA